MHRRSPARRDLDPKKKPRSRGAKSLPGQGNLSRGVLAPRHPAVRGVQAPLADNRPPTRVDKTLEGYALIALISFTVSPNCEKTTSVPHPRGIESSPPFVPSSKLRTPSCHLVRTYIETKYHKCWANTPLEVPPPMSVPPFGGMALTDRRGDHCVSPVGSISVGVPG